MNKNEVKKPYSKKAIMAAVANMTTTKSGSYVITRNGKLVVSRWRSSKLYEIVNFKDAVTSIMGVIDNIFKPTHYDIVLKKGSQELKLRGQSHTINGDVFHEMLYLTNSSNGTKKLSVRYGLLRQVCTNGMCVSVKDSSFKIKHLKANHVNKELDKFIKSLPKLDVTHQVKAIAKVAGKTITVKKVASALINGTGKKGNETIWNDLVRKLSSSKTDSLGTKEDAVIKGINVPFRKMTKETLDIKLDSYQVLNCYTELWRSLDASQIERETNKILAILS